MEDIFHAIHTFIDDLWCVYGNPQVRDGLALYRRLVQRIDEDFDKHKSFTAQIIDKFELFFNKYDNLILNGKMDEIPEGTNIYYSDNKKIKLEIARYIELADTETKNIIRQHLLLLSQMINPSDSKNEIVENVLSSDDKFNLSQIIEDDGSNESKFVNDTISKFQDTMKNANTEGESQPMDVLNKVLESGVLQETVKKFQEGTVKGEIKQENMMNIFGQLMGTMMGPGAEQGLGIFQSLGMGRPPPEPSHPSKLKIKMVEEE